MRITPRPTAFAAVALVVLSVLVPSAASHAAPPAPSQTALVSVSSTGQRSAGASMPALSADGRFVAFASPTALTALPHPAGTRQVYLRDTVTDTTVLVSTPSGASAADGDSISPSISADGRFVAYISSAMNLGTRGLPQAVLWSRDTNTSRVLSLSRDATPLPANATVNSAMISGDGSTVVFSTAATNLTNDDTRGVIQVYSASVSTGEITLVSRDRGVGTPSGGAVASTGPSVSADGQVVAFLSAAEFAGPTGGIQQVYVRASDGTVRLASPSRLGQRGASKISTSARVSGDGQVVAFVSASDDLTLEPTGGVPQVFTFTVASPTTRLASYGASGTAGGNGVSTNPSLSRDGRTVTFETQASDLGVAARAGSTQIVARDLRSGLVTLVSATRAGAAGDGHSTTPAISNGAQAVAFVSTSGDLVNVSPSGAPSEVYVRNLGEVPSVERVGGVDRYEVSAQVSARTFAPHVSTAYVASGTVFADALSGSAAAGAQGAPVLLATKDAVPDVVLAELRRLQPGRIVILGGTNTVGPAVEASLKREFPLVGRIEGADRYVVSAAISTSVFPLTNGSRPVAYVASGEVFPDALSATTAAGAQDGPVLLTQKDRLSDAVVSELNRLKPSKIVVVGGTNTLAETIVVALSKIAPTVRVEGADRYAVSASASNVFQGGVEGAVYIASGEKFPDALSGAPAAIIAGGPVLLVTAAGIPAPVQTELTRLAPRRIVVLGGPNTVSDAVVESLKPYLAK
ncbi:MAG: cell wall-binding repeat-containing protein [Herbiconiux sp.]|nr:cell wall-binding repeat-containing protein [Herbiconiux sp.]